MEYALLNSHGDVVNISYKRGEPPVVTGFQEDRGYRWVPLSTVPEGALQRYNFWSERP